MEVAPSPVEPTIFRGKVMHKRLLPTTNQFTYRIFYLGIPLSQVSDMNDGWRFGVNRRGVLSFYHQDHANRNGKTLEPWARGILAQYGINQANGEIILVTMPRVLGYVFNPVSFWMCLDHDSSLRAVLAEVNNTFGETHTYLCAHPDQRPITADDWLEAEKLFHVSPFLPREGNYRFRFAWADGKLGVWINYYNADGHQQLLTALTGKLEPYSRATLRKAFWGSPLVSLKAITLIHWQALKLFSKGVRYIRKPRQLEQKLSATENLTKM